MQRVSDCLSKSKDDLTNASYFSEILRRLEAIIAEAHEKTPPESFAFLSKMAKHVLMIISRPARILECLVTVFFTFFIESLAGLVY